MRIVILDTESTGVATTDNVIELAIHTTQIENFSTYKIEIESFENFVSWLHDETEVSRYKPKVPINPRAYEVHNIGLLELKDKPCTSSVTLPKDIDYIIGHNIAFDIRLLKQSNKDLSWLDNIKTICTMELARGLKKHLGIPLPNAKLADLTAHYYSKHVELLSPNAHAAKSDVVNTILVALAMLKHAPALETWEDLFEFQNSLKKLKKLTV